MLSGVISPAVVVHTSQVLGEVAKILKPKGLLALCEATGAETSKLKTVDSLVSALKLAGFVTVSKVGNRI